MPLNGVSLLHTPKCLQANTCTIAHHCEMSKGEKGEFEPRMELVGGQSSCGSFYPVADLRSENLRFNPTAQPIQDGWDPQTKRVKRRRPR